MPIWMAVEDEMAICDFILAMFEIWGISGVSFVDGADVMAWIEAVDAQEFNDDLPQLAFIDIRLPNVSGPEISARLRKSKWLGQMAIVLTTAYRLSPSEEQQIIKLAHADALIYKPLPPMSELHKLLETIKAKGKLRATGGPSK